MSRYVGNGFLRGASLALLLVLLLSSVALSVVYRAQIAVTETSGNSYTLVPVFVPIANKYLAANNYIDSDGRDAAVETLSGSTVQRLVADDRVMFVPTSIPASAQLNLYYTTDNTPADFPVITGYNGSLVTDDDADIELNNNFQIDVSGYVKGAMSYTATAATWLHGAIYDDGGVFTGELLDANDAGANDFFLLPILPVANDAFYFGNGLTFNRLTVNIGTQGAGNWGVVWEYYNGGWAALSNVVDGTDGWRAAAGNHDVTFTAPTDWVKVAIDGSEQLWVRARVSAFTAITIRPIGTQAWVSAPNGDILYKPNAFRFYVSATNTLSAIAGDNFPKATANAAVWTNPTYAYDDDVTTNADIVLGGAGFTGYLTLTYGATGIYTDTIRWVVPTVAGSTNRVQIDAFYGGIWNAVLDLNPMVAADRNKEWLSPIGAVQLVTQVRMRHNLTGAATTYISELDCINTGLVNNAVVTGDRVLRVTYDNVDLKLFITNMGAPVQTLNMPGYTTFDVAADYSWMGNGYSTMPYMASGLITAGAVSMLQYQPNDIVRGVAYAAGTAAFSTGSPFVVGTATTWASAMVGSAIRNDTDDDWHVVSSVEDATHLTLTANYIGTGGAAAAYTMAPRLPDRDTSGGDEMGILTWGALPAGVAVTIDSLVSAGQPLPGTGVTTAPPDVLGSTGGGNWYQGVDTGALAANNPFYPIVNILSDFSRKTDPVTHLPIPGSGFTEAQVWRFFGTMFVVLITAAAALVARGHMFIASVACSAGVVVLAMMTIYPLWTLVLLIPLLAVGVLLERSPSV